MFAKFLGFANFVTLRRNGQLYRNYLGHLFHVQNLVDKQSYSIDSSNSSYLHPASL
jgi:hypothetical protein